jgi:hypothetical protein
MKKERKKGIKGVKFIDIKSVLFKIKVQKGLALPTKHGFNPPPPDLSFQFTYSLVHVTYYVLS